MPTRTSTRNWTRVGCRYSGTGITLRNPVSGRQSGQAGTYQSRLTPSLSSRLCFCPLSTLFSPACLHSSLSKLTITTTKPRFPIFSFLLKLHSTTYAFCPRSSAQEVLKLSFSSPHLFIKSFAHSSPSSPILFSPFESEVPPLHAVKAHTNLRKPPLVNSLTLI